MHKFFLPYLEIEVGGITSRQHLINFEIAGVYVPKVAKDLMTRPGWQPGKLKRVAFARAAARDLGFTKRTKTKDVLKRVTELGHSLCKSGDAPTIRLALKNQRRGDYLHVATRPIIDSRGDPMIFTIHHYNDGLLWFGAQTVRPDDDVNPDLFEIIFRLNKAEG